MLRALILTVVSSLFTLPAFAACEIASPGKSARNHDALALLLATKKSCPANAPALRATLLGDGLSLVPTMVANRGFHNPGAGSFSFFEIAEGKSAATSLTVKAGDFFFGHFTEAEGDALRLAQTPAPGALMVELIAWDPAKKLYNFYELIGNGVTGQWFYRGDSADIAADTVSLHLQKDPAAPEFGKRLRCSGCHTNGGPIMKELALPHNDWWQPARKLPLGGRQPDAAMAEILKNLVPAETLAAAVKDGVQQLGAPARGQSLQEKLRPVFCPVELNLESDIAAGEERLGIVQVPAAFFVDPRLASGSVPASAGEYARAVEFLGFRFPETKRADADHAWLTPVKAYSDMAAAAKLVKEGVITEKFLLAILSVDATNPVFSAGRCGLLRFVPAQNSGDWPKAFAQTLSAEASKNPFAAEAFVNLTSPEKTPAWFRAKAQNFLAACAAKIQAGGLEPYVSLLAQRREEASASEISKNPRGQILEPGFRVIFPKPAQAAVPGKLHLNSLCEVSGA